METLKHIYNKKDFGKTNNGEEVHEIELKNSSLSVKVITYGATITSIVFKTDDGKSQDLVLGFDNLEGYLNDHPHFGGIIGRYANRIAEGKLKIDDKTYNLAINNGPNHLHGGLIGYDKIVWKIKELIQNDDSCGIILNYLSVDGEENYPGNLDINHTILLKGSDLIFKYEAVTDSKTVVNLTNHSYFNLNLGNSKTCLDHLVQMNSKQITEFREDNIPTGKYVDVKDGPFDFSEFRKVGEKIDALQNGYDHNFILKSDKSDRSLRYAAAVKDLNSKILMEVYTTCPGVQFYTAGFLNGNLIGKNGITYDRFGGFCLETQYFPDSPNHDHFPSTILNPGEKFEEETSYRFIQIK